MYNFEPYNVLLAIATNIPVLLMTVFVLQGHILVRLHCYTHNHNYSTHTAMANIIRTSENITSKT